MSAANTDKFKKKRSNFSTTLNGSIGSGDTTIALNSTSGLPTDTAVLLTIDRVDANGVSTPTKMERVIGVVSSNNLTNCTRGVDNSPSAQAHSSGAVVEDIWDAKSWGDAIDGILAEHTQAGLHNINTTSLVTDYVADSGSANAYAATLSPAAASYVAGMLVKLKAANANTTASTLNVNGLGAKTIKKADGSTDLAANDIVAGQLCLFVYDGTYFQLISTGSSVVTTAGTQTLSNKRRTRRAVPVTQSATPTINSDNMDIAQITGLAQAITSMSTNLSGTPNAGDLLEIQITDNGTARAITWGTSFASTTVSLPTTTVISTRLRVLLEWNATSSTWDCVAVA